MAAPDSEPDLTSAGRYLASMFNHPLRVVSRAPGDADLDMLLEQSLAELRDRYGPQAGSSVVVLGAVKWHISWTRLWPARPW